MSAEQKDSAASFIEQIKPWVETLQGIATITALITAAIWFYMQRSTKPQVKLDQIISQRQVANDPDHFLVTIDVRASNIGKTKVDLQPGELDIRQFNPTPGRPLFSFPLKQLRLEPGESDQAVFQAIELDNTIKSIQIHSDYKVPGKGSEYWNLLSVADIGDTTSRKSSESSVR